MAAKETKRIRIGGWVLEPALNRLRSDSETVSIEPRAAEVLEYLAQRPRRVVSTDELVDAVWQRKYVGDNPIYRTIADLRRQLGDDARNPEYIETIRKRGYRLVATVEWLEDSAGARPAPPADATAPDASHPSTRLQRGAAALAVAAIVATVIVFFGHRDADRGVAQSEVPVIAVIPFEDLSPGAEGQLTRGLTDAIATRLASVTKLRVIAQNSSRRFSGSADSAKAIGEQLAADYLVTGTALRRSDAEMLRVNAHLVDVASDSYVWSQTYEFPGSDIFTVQAGIAERVAQELDVTVLEAARTDRLEGTVLDAEAYRHYLRGRDALSRGWQEMDLEEAISELEFVVLAHDDFAPAHAALGLAHLQLYAQYWDRTDERLALARELVDRALELDPDSTEGHFGLGSYYLRRDMLEPALVHLERVRRDNPSHTEALAAIAQVFQRQGRLPDAIAALTAAARFDPLNHRLLYMLGQTLIVHGDYAEAESALERAITLRDDLAEGYLFKSVLHMAWRGDTSRAAAELERAADRLGMETLVEWLLQPGISGTFRFAGPAFEDALLQLKLEETAADPAAYYLALAEHANVSGQADSARAHYDEARQLLEATVAANPDEPFFYALLGSAYAGAGMASEAIAAAEQLLRLAPVESNPWDNADYLWYVAEIYLLNGMYDEALDHAEIASRYPTTLSPTWLRAEPFWAPVQDHPRFLGLTESR